jgi:hypothetical protein
MLDDPRSEALVQNFTGQWLQTRDVEGIDINARAVLSRDAGEQRDFARRRERFQELNAIPEESARRNKRRNFSRWPSVAVASKEGRKSNSIVTCAAPCARRPRNVSPT